MMALRRDPQVGREEVEEVSEPGGGFALHQRLTDVLVGVGQQMQFEVITDYGVPGGQLDVVWSWLPPSPIPDLVAPVAVVGFQIESGWQTRKHIKGDLLNLTDAGVALGVIVLAGMDASDDSLRRFATALVDRPGPRILVWGEDEVEALAADQWHANGLDTGAPQRNQGGPPRFGVTYAPASVQRTRTYLPLCDWLRRQDSEPIRLTFDELEQAGGVALPEGCRQHVDQWTDYHSAFARAIIDAGWSAGEVEIDAGTVVLCPDPEPALVRR